MSTSVWRIVAEREIRARVRDKAFLASTGVTLLLVIGLLVFGAVSGAKADKHELALGEGVDQAIAVKAQEWLRSAGREGSTVDASTPDDVERAVEDGDVDAAVVKDGETYQIIGNDKVDNALHAALAGAISEHVVRHNAATSGTDLQALYRNSVSQVRLLDPKASEADARQGIAFGFALVFLLTAMTFGMTIAQSVVQEKESRIVEILAAAVPIRSLLWGKIAGTTVLAMGQVTLLAVVGVVGLASIGERDLLEGVGPAVLWYLAFFLLGFIALACLWSVAGSLASRQEDLQSTTLPMQLILLIPYFVSATGGDQIKTVFSMLPIVSTMVMPGRMAQGDVPWWQVGVAIMVTVAAAFVLVRLGSQLYERTLLRTGGKISYRQALRRPVDA